MPDLSDEQMAAGLRDTRRDILAMRDDWDIRWTPEAFEEKDALMSQAATRLEELSRREKPKENRELFDDGKRL